MDALKHLVTRYIGFVWALLEPLGSWAVFAIAGIDSAFFGVPLDPVVATYVYQNRSHALLYPLLAAAGSAPFNGGYAQLDPALVSLSYNGTPVFVGGAPQNSEPPVDGGVCTIELDLGLGDGSAGYLTSDLSYDYVRINAEYRS